MTYLLARITTKEQLMFAAECGDVAHVRWCVDRHVPAHFVLNHVTPLLVAARNGRERVVRHLLSRGVSPRSTGSEKLTALHTASFAGHLGVVRALIAAGANMDAQESKGFTPLHYSILHDHADLSREYVSRGANMELVSKDNCNALHLAAQQGSLFHTKLLVERDCPMNRLGGPSGWTAAQMACYKGHEDVALFLLRAGARPCVLSEDGHQLVHIAAQSRCVRVLAYLADAIDMNMRNARGDHVLHFAAVAGHTDVLEGLLRVPTIDVNAQQRDGFTPLLFAVAYQKMDAVRILLNDVRLDVNKADNTMRTALIKACIQNDVDMVRCVLSHVEVNTNLCTVRGSYPIHFCCSNGNLDVLRELFAAGADLYRTNEDGMCGIHIASIRGHTSVVRWLVDVAKMDPEHRTARGGTPLQLAAQENKVSTALFLLTRKTSLATMGTALLVACKKGHADLVRILWKHGARDAVFDEARPIHIAAECGHTAIVRDLISWGEDPAVPTKRGATVRDIALRANNRALLELVGP
jgi:ankyrin repeat protein